MIENPIFAERSQAYVSLRHIGNELRKASSRHLARLGTTDAHFGVLRALHNRDGQTLSEIRTWVLTGSSNISTLMRRMEREGLVELFKGHPDQRFTKARLTDKGRALAEATITPHRQYVTDLLSCFSPKELEELNHLLEKLDKHLSLQDRRLTMRREVYDNE